MPKTRFVFKKHWEHYQQHLFSRLSPKLPNKSPTHASTVPNNIPNIFLCGGLQPEASQFKQQCCAAGSQGEGRGQGQGRGQPKACRPQVPSQGGMYDIAGRYWQHVLGTCYFRSIKFAIQHLPNAFTIAETVLRFSGQLPNTLSQAPTQGLFGGLSQAPHKDCLGILRECTCWGSDSEMLKARSVFKKRWTKD